MEVRLYDLAADAVANAVDAGYLYIECAYCGSAGWWAKPLETISCPTCDKPITAPAEGQTLVEQIRAWREMFVEYPDSHIGAIGYQVCERLIDELAADSQLVRRNRQLEGALQHLTELANEPLPETGEDRYDAGLAAMDAVYRSALIAAVEIADIQEEGPCVT